MSKKMLITILIGLISITIIVLMIIPRETSPSDDTRIILEHNKGTYIAPGCFEQSNPTNYLEDSTLSDAHDNNYDPNSSCTVEALESHEEAMLISLLKDIGILSKKWDNW